MRILRVRYGIRSFSRLVGALAAALFASGSSACSLASASSRYEASKDSTLGIVFFDVGQGDAALIISPAGKKVLVDAGPAATEIVQHLRGMGIDTLDLVVASHNHADHIGGMAAVISSVVVRNYLENEMPATTRTYANVIHALESRHVSVLRATPRRIDLGGGASARVIVGKASANTQNNRSIGLLVTYGKFAALFTGDAEGPERAFWDDSAAIGPVQVLKVAHHGSINGTDARFLKLLQPCVAIISVGNPNKFGHPSPTVLGLLRGGAGRIYRTDVDGQIMVTASRSGALTVIRGSSARSIKPSVDQVICTPSAR